MGFYYSGSLYNSRRTYFSDLGIDRFDFPDIDCSRGGAVNPDCYMADCNDD